MNILVISDSHGFLPTLTSSPDVVFLLGDIDYYELRKIDQLFTCPKFGVLGNHDGPDYFDGTSIQNVHEKVVEWNGYTIGGFGGCPRYNKRSFLQFHEQEAAAFVNNAPRVDFFLAHSNPQFEVNHDLSDAHRGFRCFSHYIYQKQPAYFFHGHIHEADSYEANETTIISVYPTHFLTI